MRLSLKLSGVAGIISFTSPVLSLFLHLMSGLIVYITVSGNKEAYEIFHPIFVKYIEIFLIGGNIVFYGLFLFGYIKIAKVYSLRILLYVVLLLFVSKIWIETANSDLIKQYLPENFIILFSFLPLVSYALFSFSVTSLKQDYGGIIKIIYWLGIFIAVHLILTVILFILFPWLSFLGFFIELLAVLPAMAISIAPKIFDILLIIVLFQASKRLENTRYPDNLLAKST